MLKDNAIVPEAKVLVAKSRKIAGHFRHSPNSEKKLHDEQKSINLPTKNLVQSNETRWDSTHDNLESTCQQERPLTLFNAHNPGKITPFTEYEYLAAGEIVAILHPLREGTIRLQGRKYITVSLFLPVVKGIQKRLGQEEHILVGVDAGADKVKKEEAELTPLARRVASRFHQLV